MVSRKEHLERAVEAHTALCMFENISTMLESSDIRGTGATAAASKAVKILRAEQQMLLRRYDRAAAALRRENPDA